MAHIHKIGSGSIDYLSVPLKAYTRQRKTGTDRFKKEYEYSLNAINFKGSFHPMSEKIIQLKPRDQWALEWYIIKTTDTKAMFNIKDRIEFNNTLYLIQKRKDWSSYGYISYEVVVDLIDS